MIRRRTVISGALALFLTLALFALSAFAAPKEGTVSSFQILFTSDLHGSLTNFNYATGKETVGGFSKLATLIKQEKAAFDGPTYVIDNGDTIQGNGTSLFINEKYKPFPMISAFNAAGYDAVSLGNHEFNFGLQSLYGAYTGFKGAKLNANVTDAKGQYLRGFKPYVIFTAPEGLRVAVIGLVTPNIELWDAGNMKKDGTKAESASMAARKVIDDLKKKKLADIFVAAAHMGETGEYGREGSGAIDVAAVNPELAVILGAHYHTIRGTRDNQVVLADTGIKFVENKNAGASLGKVIITATYEGGEWTLKNKSGSYEDSGVRTDVIAVTKDTPADPDAEAAIAAADKAARDYINNTVVGRLEGGPLVPEPEIAGTYEGYLRDTPLSDLVNNVMLHFSGADIAGTAPLDTNANHQPGEITVGGVVQIYKYDNNTLYKLSMTGAQLVKWMEWSYSYFGSTVNGQPDHSKPAVNPETDLTIPFGTMQGYNQDQFAGIIYEVDLTKPVGERIHVISMANGEPFGMEKEYTVAANDYRSSTQLLHNSDSGVFKPGEKTAVLLAQDIQAEGGLTSMLDLIIEYIRMQPGQTIYNTCDNNWRFINLNWDPQLRKEAVEAINNGLITTDFKTPVTREQVEALKATAR